MSDDAQEWRWVGEDGVEKTVTEQELIAELSSESLPNYTLVWKKRWLEWLPAMQVAELIWALPPGKADAPVKPREKDGAAAPPAPPLYRYPVVKRRAANLKTDKPAPVSSATAAPRPAPKKEPAPPTPPTPVLTAPEPPPPPPPPPLAAVPAPVIATAEQVEARRPVILDAPTQEWRPPDSRPVEDVDMDSIEASDPIATSHAGDSDALLLDDDDGTDEAVSDPLHPAEFGAAPVSRSGFSPVSYGEEDDAETRVIPSRPPGPLYVAPHAPPASERPPASYDDDLEEFPHIPPPSPPPANLSAYAASASSGGRRKFAMYGAGAVVALAAAAWLLRGGHKSDSVDPAASAVPVASVTPSGTAEPAAATTTEPTANTPHLGKPCTIATAATKVADWADPAVVPAFANIPGSERVAVGFAQSETYAIGITIDPKTLDRDQVFREFRKQKLVSVVPTATAGSLHFQVVRDGFSLTNARAVDASTPFFLGVTPDGMARVVNHGAPTPVWPFPEAEQSTVARVATVPGVGHAVTFRRGGKSGVPVAGWLEPSGEKKTELVDIKADGDFAGTPAIGASEDAILIAFASRKADGPGWNIMLASAKHGELPTVASKFVLPPGGPGGDGISPAIGALAGGRWLLHWTEGSSGSRVARAEVLDRNLSSLSAPINLSPDGANAGQGVVFTNGDVGSILFYVQNDKKNHELWGASVECVR